MSDAASQGTTSGCRLSPSSTTPRRTFPSSQLRPGTLPRRSWRALCTATSPPGASGSSRPARLPAAFGQLFGQQFAQQTCSKTHNQALLPAPFVDNSWRSLATRKLCIPDWQFSESTAGPRRVEFLTHDISVHVPHHVNSKIPWYNLRKAHESLQSNWGQVGAALAVSCSLPAAACLRFNTAPAASPASL